MEDGPEIRPVGTAGKWPGRAHQIFPISSPFFHAFKRTSGQSIGGPGSWGAGLLQRKGNYFPFLKPPSKGSEKALLLEGPIRPPSWGAGAFVGWAPSGERLCVQLSSQTQKQKHLKNFQAPPRSRSPLTNTPAGLPPFASCERLERQMLIRRQRSLVKGLSAHLDSAAGKGRSAA